LPPRDLDLALLEGLPQDARAALINPRIQAEAAGSRAWLNAELPGSLFPAFFGLGHQVTNTPAVALGSGTIYIPGAGHGPETTVLYGIREKNSALETVFAREFPGRCAVTPSLSPDEQNVYTGNADGELFAFDTLHGTLRWNYSPAGPAASPSVGADGTVYTGTSTLKGRPSELSAINPLTG